MSISCDHRSCNSQKDIKLHELLLNKEYSLNVVNNYGDSLLHVSAAFGCAVTVNTILNQNKNSLNIDRKNKFGWTPLMNAIRGGNIETVKVLLKNGADVTQRTYLGTSTLTLAAGIGSEMLETIYKTRPTMLKDSIHDDITPLCVAALKNDKNLFLKLIDLGLEINNECESLAEVLYDFSRAQIRQSYLFELDIDQRKQLFYLKKDLFVWSIYTHLVMQQSRFPEIRSLAKQQIDIEEYWNNQSDNIRTVGKESRAKSGERSELSRPVNYKSTGPLISVDSPEQGAWNLIKKSLNSRNEAKLPNLNLLCLKEDRIRENQSISPNLIYNLDPWFAKSSNLSYSLNPILPFTPKQTQSHNSYIQRQQTQQNVFIFDNFEENPSPVTSGHSARDIQPMDPQADNPPLDHNTSLTFIPEFSPSRSPCLPSDFEEEDVCGEETPTPPHYKTPPQGMVLNSGQAKLVIMLKQFDLAHHISTFLREEVDMNLFLTLNDQDLTEIGISNEMDRKALLAVIDAYTTDEK